MRRSSTAPAFRPEPHRWKRYRGALSALLSQWRPNDRPMLCVCPAKRGCVTRTVNPSRKLPRFESWTRHVQGKSTPDLDNLGQGPIFVRPAESKRSGRLRLSAKHHGNADHDAVALFGVRAAQDDRAVWAIGGDEPYRAGSGRRRARRQWRWEGRPVPGATAWPLISCPPLLLHRSRYSKDMVIGCGQTPLLARGTPMTLTTETSTETSTGTATPTQPASRIVKIRQALSPREWIRVGGMVGSADGHSSRRRASSGQRGTTKHGPRPSPGNGSSAMPS